MDNSLISKTDFDLLEIHAPRIVGTYPDTPFHFLIPATGNGNLKYHVKNLPEGLDLDTSTGIISGMIKTPGVYNVDLMVSDSQGMINRNLNIKVGKHVLALTPPMGWNSWNVWSSKVCDLHIRQTADALIEKKLAAFGYHYVNIDDCWEGSRDTTGKITSNQRFPNMKSLGDYIHSKGLKFGIYSSPGPKTCGNYEGSYSHELEDARTYGDWGVDYLKYDWCSYAKLAKKPIFTIPHLFYDDRLYIHTTVPLNELKKPYQKMREALDKIPQNIIYSLCPITLNGKWNASNWGPHVQADLWRTTGDIKDNWKSMSHIGFRQYRYYQTHGPGFWNDPDMLVVGKLSCDKPIHTTHLNPIEQVTHMTLWVILAAPLLISCDLTQIDDFTLNLLTNTEVIDVDQDPLGIMGKRVVKKGPIEVYMRPLWDNTHAIAIFNRSKKDKQYTLHFKSINLSEQIQIRDLWQKRDYGKHNNNIQINLPAHGSKLLKLGVPCQII